MNYSKILRMAFLYIGVISITNISAAAPYDPTKENDLRLCALVRKPSLFVAKQREKFNAEVETKGNGLVEKVLEELTREPKKHDRHTVIGLLSFVDYQDQLALFQQDTGPKYDKSLLGVLARVPDVKKTQLWDDLSQLKSKERTPDSVYDFGPQS